MKRAIANADIAAIFEEIADLLEVQRANAYRVRAYRNAARLLKGHAEEMRLLLARGEALDELPGIGADLAGKIAEIVETGRSPQLEALRQEVPPALAELLKLPGIGPRRIAALRRTLGIGSMDELRAAASDGRVRLVRGFGPRVERQILDAIGTHRASALRTSRPAAAALARELLADLAGMAGVTRAVAAGSLRRRRDTVGDLDLLVAVRGRNAVVAHFTAGERVQRVLSRGRQRAGVVLESGLQVDLRLIAEESFGAAWLYFTGSKAHGIALRRIAQSAGLKLNEYGLFRGNRRIAGASEAGIYAALGMPFIEPELREDRGEIAAALAGSLPALVTRGMLRGDLHTHTVASDGRDDLLAMAEAARRRGLEYLAITDHSRRIAIAHGLDAGRLALQIDRIDAMNAQLGHVTLLKGVEVDILEDGSLDLPDDILRRLDLVVGAIHSGFGLSREKQTARVLRAMDRPCFSILAHPTARLLGVRQAIDIDLRAVARHARQRGCFLELNAQPDRLDLDDEACRIAREEGVLVSIASDAHGAVEIDNLEHGIGQARRGWLGHDDVLNTRDLVTLRALLDRTMDRRGTPGRRERRGAGIAGQHIGVRMNA